MKRRKLAMLLAAAMMAATLAGCGGGSSESTTAAPTEAQTEAAGEARLYDRDGRPFSAPDAHTRKGVVAQIEDLRL